MLYSSFISLMNWFASVSVPFPGFTTTIVWKLFFTDCLLCKISPVEICLLPPPPLVVVHPWVHWVHSYQCSDYLCVDLVYLWMSFLFWVFLLLTYFAEYYLLNKFRHDATVATLLDGIIENFCSRNFLRIFFLKWPRLSPKFMRDQKNQSKSISRKICEFLQNVLTF